MVEGFELGTVYEPGTGMMAGDFYDVYPTSPDRLAVVIGDVAGHGIEPSITAFQVKYLLRNFLRQYRDPAQALEELNVVLSATGRPEDLVSVCAVVFDTTAGTLRYASAGHPPAWLWQDSEMRALRSTGPLLTLDPAAALLLPGAAPRAGRPARSCTPTAWPRPAPGASSSGRSASPASSGGTRARTQPPCARSCWRRPGTSPPSRSPTTSPSWLFAGSGNPRVSSFASAVRTVRPFGRSASRPSA